MKALTKKRGSKRLKKSMWDRVGGFKRIFHSKI
jgi:hypothetical protein